MAKHNHSSKLFAGFEVRRNVPAKDYTSFRIGGPMAYFAEPSSAEELKALIEEAKRIDYPYYVIGNGSNLLISDEGVDALVIRLGNRFASFTFDGCKVSADAGALLSLVAKTSVAAGLAGLEWAAGIPGTIGGGAAMNAGAYGGEMKQVVRAVTYLKDGELITRKVVPEDLGYRFSVFAYPEAVVVKVMMELKEDDGSAKERMLDYAARRKSKQPLEMPSAGSTFKRPKVGYAGSMIEEAGLKGASIGGAMVSTKHAGFIVNTGGATFEDVTALIRHVQQTVYDKFGVTLEPEVKIIEG